MKLKFPLLLSTFFLASQLWANSPTFNKNDLAKLDWQAVSSNQKIASQFPSNQTILRSGEKENVIGYKIPANQGTIKLTIRSFVLNNQSLFVPNVLVFDNQFNLSMQYPASQFKLVEERGLEDNHLQAELNLTPMGNQDYLYVLIYTTEQDLRGSTTFAHPAKRYAKAKNNQPPAIDDITVKHSRQGRIQLETRNEQNTQWVGLGALFEKSSLQQTVGQTQMAMPVTKQPPAEKSTEDYFNQAVRVALKKNDVNKALNLINEAEKLGITTPRQIFLQQISVK